MTDVDVVVIGSGAGGLTAAVALAQAGKKVLVLEQHDVPGGWCHSFTLEGYKFSPGVHYIGELQEGGRMRAIYEGMGVSGDMDFCELNPDGYDHIVVGKERFDIPKGREEFAARLSARFPSEREGIRNYLDTTAQLGRELDSLMDVRGLRGLASLPKRAPALTRWGLRSAQSFINHHARDPVLRAILAGQCGDHGLPPSMAPAPVHASVTAHYFDGGYYPRGGAFVLPRAYVRALKRAGGEIRLKTAVSRILMEQGKAIGVRLADGTEIRAGAVISNADPQMTFTRLVGTENLPATLRARLALTRYSVSALSLYMAVDMDARAAGLDSGNLWYYSSPDVEGAYRQGMTSWNEQDSEISGMFLTVTTLKDPSKMVKGHHTMEAFAFIGYDAFAQWADTTYGARPDSYNRMKEALRARLLATVNTMVPGLRERVVFSDVGTPLTNAHYCASTRGNLYGTQKSLLGVGPFAYPVRSAIGGLWMCGASTLSHGVMGATVSGLVAARSILRCRVSDLLQQKGPALRIYPSEHPELWPENLRRRAGVNVSPEQQEHADA